MIAAGFGIVTGVFGSVTGSLNMSVVTLAIAPEVRGRVMAIMMMSFGVMPLGMIPIAGAAEVVGIAPALLGQRLADGGLDGQPSACGFPNSGGSTRDTVGDDPHALSRDPLTHRGACAIFAA